MIQRLAAWDSNLPLRDRKNEGGGTRNTRSRPLLR
jgi:hypothetical protein